jgi:hypothetical protein
MSEPAEKKQLVTTKNVLWSIFYAGAWVGGTFAAHSIWHIGWVLSVLLAPVALFVIYVFIRSA